MEQRINDRAMYFTLLVEALLRGESNEALGHVTETTVIDAMYALRAAIERDEERQRAVQRNDSRMTQEDARDIAAEARWMERNEQDGVPYGTY